MLIFNASAIFLQIFIVSPFSKQQNNSYTMVNKNGILVQLQFGVWCDSWSGGGGGEEGGGGVLRVCEKLVNLRLKSL